MKTKYSFTVSGMHYTVKFRTIFIEGVVAYDLLGALKALRHAGFFTVAEYNTSLKNYRLYGYEQRDPPTPLRPELKQERLAGNAMGMMVHLREMLLPFAELLVTISKK
jgi:hypothetical protein